MRWRPVTAALLAGLAVLYPTGEDELMLDRPGGSSVGNSTLDAHDACSRFVVDARTERRAAEVTGSLPLVKVIMLRGRRYAWTMSHRGTGRRRDQP